jgi:2-amino-4-hydroxy-6-hydroxymethyldihydropteridine diphosphokinase
MGQFPRCRIRRCSPWFLTRPVGVEHQDWYVNGVAALEVEISAHELLARLLQVESDMGRVRTEKWGARTIDLDLLLFGPEIIRNQDLQVPHLLMHMRKFVLVPMVYLAPKLVHPVFRLTMADLLKSLEGEGQEVVLFKVDS